MIRVDCILDAKASLGEGIVWDEREGLLWWVDIDGRSLNGLDPSSLETRRIGLPSRPGCLAMREAGGILITLEDGFHFLDPATGALEPIVDPEPDRPGNRFNDGAADPAGRMIAGTMPLGPREPVAAFYQLGTDLSCRLLMNGFTVTNGVAFSPDGRTFYFSETVPQVRTVWAADYDPETGEMANRRVFVDTHGLDSRPDGGTIDADGCYWMAGLDGGQLVRFTPEGRVDRTVDMPVRKPTKIAFGGGGLDTLYVTSIGAGADPAVEPQAGGIFALRVPGVQGMPALRFGG
ncbi:MAG: SMP-30/gluconolactonase/LRE family protein [Geminicoccaceae bacterium]|nr:SMP-30/gluconolactonase/LRE family protein [Geminicoccaceae bacterium]